MNRKKAVMLSIVTATMLLSGCTANKNELKEEALLALEKQKEVTQYTFSGEADLNIGLSGPASGSNEVTGTLLSMFNKSKISWAGKTSQAPLRLEANYKIMPGGSTVAFDLPLLIIDDIFYLSIPLLNKQGEYFSFDPQDVKADDSSSSVVPDFSSLTNVNQAFSESLKTIVSDFDPKWFSTEKDAVTLSDGGKGKTISIRITDKNKAAITESIQAQLPEVLEIWRSEGIYTGEQEEHPKTSLQSMEINSGVLAFVVDEQGFIRKQTAELDYTLSANSDNTAQYIHYNQSFDQINEAPTFEQPVPELTRPFTEVMKLIK